MRGRDLIRLLQALELLSRKQGATIKELQEKLEVSKRTVYYKLDMIQSLGIPVYDDRVEGDKQKRWKVLDEYLERASMIKVPDIRLKLPEVLALYLLRSQDRLYRGTDVEKLLDSAFSKMGMFVPEKVFDRLARIKTLFASPAEPSKDYSGKEETIELLTMAMLRRQTCLVAYHSFSTEEFKTFYIDPLNFFESRGGLYVFVRSTSFGDIRTLAVERIHGIKETDKVFIYPEGFDPEATLRSAFGIIYDEPFLVRIWFSSAVARYIRERTWSPTQEIKNAEDGAILLEMNTCGRQDIKRWVMGFGTDANLLEPSDLRAEISADLSHSTKAYAGGSPGSHVLGSTSRDSREAQE